jgi:nitrile hydratase subunit beta
MNSIADMGGMHGFGPVDRSEGGGPFHHEWERRILGITFATLGAGLYNVDEIRRVTESIEPITYLRSSYYERWLDTAIALLQEKGVFNSEELAAGRSAAPPHAPGSFVNKETARSILEHGGTSRAANGAPARFRVGDAVIARNINPTHHTRLPRYIRGKRGVIALDHGVFALPDSNASGLGTSHQHVYGVRFTARELWGPEASSRDTLQIDLFDDYLDLSNERSA